MKHHQNTPTFSNAAHLLPLPGSLAAQAVSSSQSQKTEDTFKRAAASELSLAEITKAGGIVGGSRLLIA